MKNITKNEFTELITNNKIIFMGLSKTLFEKEYIYNFVNDNYINTDAILEERSYIKKSNFVISDSGSRLDINNNESITRNCYKYSFNDFIVIVMQESYQNYKFDEEYNKIYFTDYKNMYYLIKK